MKKLLAVILSLMLVAALVCGAVGCLAEETQALKKGSIITFGRYPQTEEGTDETPIEWMVLKVDKTNSRVLLLSKYLLEMKPYNTKDMDVTWETCTLRRWLNRDFMNKAFTPEEKAAILLTDVDNSDTQGYSSWMGPVTGGNNTQDYVFLLSYAEANQYMRVKYGDTTNKYSQAAPTAYVIKQGARIDIKYSTSEGIPAACWWLRSPSKKQRFVAYVDRIGALSGTCAYFAECVRPAMWVSLDAISSAP